jgi:hypothetical protein
VTGGDEVVGAKVAGVTTMAGAEVTTTVGITTSAGAEEVVLGPPGALVTGEDKMVGVGGDDPTTDDSSQAVLPPLMSFKTRKMPVIVSESRAPAL